MLVLKLQSLSLFTRRALCYVPYVYGRPSALHLSGWSGNSHATQVKRAALTCSLCRRGELCMLNRCAALAEVDIDGIPPLPANLQSCSDGGGNHSEAAFQMEKWLLIISSLSCEVNKPLPHWRRVHAKLFLFTGWAGGWGCPMVKSPLSVPKIHRWND